MYLQEMLVPHITHAYMVSRQGKQQASKQASKQSSGAKQAGVRQHITIDAITSDVVTARDEAMITYINHSWRNYTGTELATER